MTSTLDKCLERWESLNKACLDALTAMDQWISGSRCGVPGVSHNDIQGRFDAISDQIMNLDVKVGDQVEMDGNW